jgi:hypothetical protein
MTSLDFNQAKYFLPASLCDLISQDAIIELYTMTNDIDLKATLTGAAEIALELSNHIEELEKYAGTIRKHYGKDIKRLRGYE